MNYTRFQQMRNTRHVEKKMYEWRRSDVHKSYKHMFLKLSPPKRELQHLWLQILHTGRFLHCSDSRDRLYGLFGILQETRMSVPQLDYSIPVQIVFENFYLPCYTDRTKPLGAHVYPREERDLQLPSWVPD